MRPTAATLAGRQFVLTKIQTFTVMAMAAINGLGPCIVSTVDITKDFQRFIITHTPQTERVNIVVKNVRMNEILMVIVPIADIMTLITIIPMIN